MLAVMNVHTVVKFARLEELRIAGAGDFVRVGAEHAAEVKLPPGEPAARREHHSGSPSCRSRRPRPGGRRQHTSLPQACGSGEGRGGVGEWLSRLSLHGLAQASPAGKLRPAKRASLTQKQDTR